MSKGSRLGSSQGVTRRGFTAARSAPVLSWAAAARRRSPRASAICGSASGAASSAISARSIRFDIQGGLVLYNIFDSLVKIDFAKRTIEPMLALGMVQSRSADLAHQAARGREVAEGLRRVHRRGRRLHWNFHLESKSFQVGTALFPVDTRQGRRQVRRRGQDQAAVRRLPRRHHGLWRHHHLGQGAQGDGQPGLLAPRRSATAPFQIESKRGTEIILVKNPDYWRPGFPKLDKVVYRAIPDSTTRLQALVKNELDFVTHPDPEGGGRECARTPTSSSSRRRAGNGTSSSST